MFCPQCGASNADLDRYCIACGADMTPPGQGHSPTASPQPGAPAQYQQPQYQQQPYQQPAQQSSYPPPPYQQPAYQQSPYSNQYQSTPTNYGMPVSLPTYLGWAIATLILCFWPASVVAIVYSTQVNTKLARGDYNGAIHSSRRARLWCWISFGVVLAGIVFAVIALVIGAAVANS